MRQQPKEKKNATALPTLVFLSPSPLAMTAADPPVAELDALIAKFLADTRAVVPIPNPAFDPAQYHPEREGQKTLGDKPKPAPKRSAGG